MKKTNRTMLAALLLCVMAGSFALTACNGDYYNPNMGRFAGSNWGGEDNDGNGTNGNSTGGNGDDNKVPGIPAGLVGRWGSGTVEAFEIKTDGTGKVSTVSGYTVSIEGKDIVFKLGSTEEMRIVNYSLSNGDKTLTGTRSGSSVTYSKLDTGGNGTNGNNNNGNSNNGNGSNGNGTDENKVTEIPAGLVGSWGVGTVEYLEIKADGTGKWVNTEGYVSIEGKDIVFKFSGTELMRIANYSLSNGDKTLTGTYSGSGSSVTFSKLSDTGTNTTYSLIGRWENIIIVNDIRMVIEIKADGTGSIKDFYNKTVYYGKVTITSNEILFTNSSDGKDRKAEYEFNEFFNGEMVLITLFTEYGYEGYSYQKTK